MESGTGVDREGNLAIQYAVLDYFDTRSAMFFLQLLMSLWHCSFWRSEEEAGAGNIDQPAPDYLNNPLGLPFLLRGIQNSFNYSCGPPCRYRQRDTEQKLVRGNCIPQIQTPALLNPLYFISPPIFLLVFVHLLFLFCSRRSFMPLLRWWGESAESHKHLIELSWEFGKKMYLRFRRFAVRELTRQDSGFPSPATRFLGAVDVSD